MSSAERPGAIFPDKRTLEDSTKGEKRNLRTAKGKTPRIPGMPIDKLEVRNRQAGMHYTWVVDDRKGRLEEFLESGYVHVAKSDPEVVSAGDMTSLGDNSVDSRVSKVVNSDGTAAYLLRLPEETYKEHQAWRDKQSKEPLDQIASGREVEAEGLYHVGARFSRE